MARIAHKRLKIILVSMVILTIAQGKEDTKKKDSSTYIMSQDVNNYVQLLVIYI